MMSAEYEVSLNMPLVSSFEVAYSYLGFPIIVYMFCILLFGRSSTVWCWHFGVARCAAGARVLLLDYATELLVVV